MTGKKSAFPFAASIRFWRLDALKWPHPVPLSVSRYATPTHAARARGCCTRPALMSHDCIQIPEFFFHASALFHRARESSVSLSRFFPADGNDASKREFLLFFFPFFLLFRGNFYRRWSASRVNAFFDFWNGFIIIILERVYRLIESPVEIPIILL